MNNEKSDQEKSPEAPSPVDLEKRMAVLEKQVRQEIDVRIIAFLLENIKQARSLLSPEEMQLYTDHLAVILQNPGADFTPPVQKILEKIKGDSITEDSLESARILIEAKFKAEDIGSASSRHVRHLLGKSEYENENRSLKDLIRQQRSA